MVVLLASVSEIQKKIGAKLVSNGIVGRNLRKKQKVPFPNPASQHHWIRVRHEFFLWTSETVIT